MTIINSGNSGKQPDPLPYRRAAREAREEKPSFFRPYKRGYGFWTRLGTGIGAALLIIFTIQFLYSRLPAWANLRRDEWILYAVLAGVGLALAAVAWWLINRPRSVDFLINTDGEMKKVTWPTWRELIGSTKVVTFFMFFIAFLLFAYDIIFGYAAYFLDVLKIAPLTM